MTETAKLPVRNEKSGSAEAGLTSLDRMRREMDRLFDEFGRGLFSFPSRLGEPDIEPFWRARGRGIEPIADVVERSDRYEITAELPGMDEKNIEIKLSNGNLTISGEKKEEKEEKEASYYMTERRYGSFQRSFRLPESIDSERIEATFKNGVLTISLPKTEKAKKENKIAIKTA
jgi:HSP20 family protein